MTCSVPPVCIKLGKKILLKKKGLKNVVLRGQRIRSCSLSRIAPQK